MAITEDGAMRSGRMRSPKLLGNRSVARMLTPFVRRGRKAVEAVGVAPQLSPIPG